MKINKIYVLIVLLFLAGTIAVNGRSSDGLNYQKIYEVDKDWCNSLYIDISGTNITSNEYYLQDCGQSATANRWYCNCKTDEDFNIIFINGAEDTKSYIVDIYATGQHIKRVISKNNLDHIASNVTPKPNLKKFEFDTKNIDIKLNSFEKELNKLTANIKHLENNNKVETINNPIITNQTIENNYNDSSILLKLENIEETQKGFSLRVIVSIVLLLLLCILYPLWLSGAFQE